MPETCQHVVIRFTWHPSGLSGSLLNKEMQGTLKCLHHLKGSSHKKRREVKEKKHKNGKTGFGFGKDVTLAAGFNSIDTIGHLRK